MKFQKGDTAYYAGGYCTITNVYDKGNVRYIAESTYKLKGDKGQEIRQVITFTIPPEAEKHCILVRRGKKDDTTHVRNKIQNRRRR